ncbi:MAG: sigma-54 dependent transcriptional regulator [Deltaproteobacteria bacterium]|jgi:two-component system response regulator PilR (NtrC family)|nr:sigma-54 dependent transcriptional regulator [Deltaproteobacteria bacterium]
MEENTYTADILIVDDESSLRRMLSIAMKRAGHQVTAAPSGEEALVFLASAKFDIVITDLKMPGIGGMELLKKVKVLNPETEVLVITAHGTIDSAMEAVRAGAFDYIQKPFKMAEIELAVLRAIEQNILRRENYSLKRELGARNFLGKMVGKSKQMQGIFNLIRKTAPTSANVLITGESGTGKELVAHSIHQLSKRSEQSFLAVNCGAIPENLLESELFGHEKGAFTGAEQKKPGLFRAADGGTLLLDEIGELPQMLQVKLLRSLQEKKIKPVGGINEIPVNVRIVASTNRNLQTEIEKGNFRKDLYYRLNVIHIHIPPLNERREDILPLARHLLHKLAQEANLPVPNLSENSERFLQNYDYSGNIRELENLLERALVLDTDSNISTNDLKPMQEKRPRLEGGIDLDQKMEEVEKQYILEALNKTGWNRTKSAEILGISFRSLRYRMSKLDLDRSI